jgi:hypothetical protein
MKLAYSSSGLYAQKANVTSGGNNQMCFTLRDPGGTAQWNKIKVKPQGASSPVVYLGAYVTVNPGADWSNVCIPLTAFGSINFTQLSFIELQCNNAAPFEIQIQRIEFTGGATPFLWFGDPKTDNFHDGTSGSSSELITTLVQGTPCGAPKLSGEDLHNNANGYFENSAEMFLTAYPNPFNEEVTISFSLQTAQRARVEITSVDGRLVAKLFDAEVNAGELNNVSFGSRQASNGIYFYRLISESGAVENRKLILLR